MNSKNSLVTGVNRDIRQLCTISCVMPVSCTTKRGMLVGGRIRDVYVPSSKGIPSGESISPAISIMLQLEGENPVVSRSNTT